MKNILLLGTLFFVLPIQAQMTTVGSAFGIGGGCNQFQLTPPATNDIKGAIWTQTAIDLSNDFDMTFEVWFQSELSGLFAADGMAFVLQQNATGIGDHGSGMGFASPFGAPPISGNQIAIELDIFDNGGSVPSDDANDHLGINSGGGKNHDMLAATPFLGNQIITDGAWHEFRVVWQAGFNTLLVFWEGAAIPIITLNNDIVTNEFGGNPIVYWGWTAATGGIPCQMQVRALSSPSFTSDLTSVCPGFPVQFTDGTTSPVGPAVTWSWDFDDGSPIDNTQNPSHTYTAPGTYNVTLTVSDGFCDTAVTNTITVLDSITMNMTATDVTCFGDVDGDATSTPTNGTGPYNYLWNDVGTQSTQTATNLPPGWYTVEVIDNLGCVGYDSVEVQEPAPLAMNMDSTDVTCNGDTDGTTTATPTNGASPYSYLWDDGGAQTTQTATGLAPGWYIVNVTDNDGCMATDSIEVGEPITITLTMDSTDASCNGGTDGTATATANSGSAPFMYSWNDGGTQTTQTATGLPAGTYTVLLTDNNGCTAVDSVEVIEAAGITMTMDSIPTTCFGGSDGSAIVSVLVGTPPYNYLWDDIGAQTTDTATALPAGIYVVQVSDGAGCIVTDTVEVTEPAQITGNVTPTDVDCNGNSTGAATVTAVNGTSPYTYLWDDTGAQTTQTATGLPTGSYSVVITDADGCTGTGTTIIAEPTALAGTITTTDDFGGPDGTVNITVTGGTTPYSFAWSNGSTNEDLSGLVAGTYDVIITDDNGCTFNLSGVVDEILDLDFPTAISPNSDGQNDTYVIIGLQAFPTNSFVVTNRWGNVVFKMDDYDNSWGGDNMSGEPLPEGVYFMVFESGIEQHTRYVEIRRQ